MSDYDRYLLELEAQAKKRGDAADGAKGSLTFEEAVKP